MNLNDLLDRSAARKPAAVALLAVKDGAEEETSFQALRHLVLRAAAAFRQAGLAKGDHVCIVHRNDPAFVVAYLGLVRIGAVAVPINFMITKPDELAYMFRHCGAKAVVASREFLKGVQGAQKDCPALTRVWTTDERRRTGARRGGPEAGATENFWDAVDAQPPFEDASEVSAEDAAAVLYTSGTTGRPKGVVLTHGNLVSNCDASISAMGLSESDVSMTLLPMFHSFAWTACVLIPLRLGGKNVIVASLTPPKPWLTLMGRHRVSVFAAVPQVYSLLAKQACGLKAWVLRYWFFRKVRIAVSGAAPLSPQTHREFAAAFGLEILEGYGLTETSPVATINRPGRLRVGSVGPPIADVSVAVAAEDGALLPEGQEGEVLIKGPNVMKGYLHDAQATRAAMTPSGWFKTGDIGVVDADGYLHIRDRKKDMIIVKGLKVFSAQVEQVISGHPDVAEAAVVGIPDADNDERIKAFIVLRQGAAADTAELHRFCREKLDAYKRPRDIELVPELPKNALQKVLKRVLRDAELAKAARARP
ncbi:MAG: long-chain-fatty-acid--CoA ligase [Elusimicrobia bacterium]|nr:long-chain-fatty-acid--CoA ligase [Elusimicrobiota bacterium]